MLILLFFAALVVVVVWPLVAFFVALAVVLLVAVLVWSEPSDQEVRERERERQIEEMLRRPPKKRQARSTSGISPWGTSGSGGGLPSQRGR